MVEIIDHLTPNKRFWIVIKFALLISFIEAFAQYHLKNDTPYLGILGYIGVACVLIISYKYENLGHMNLVWSCVSIIVCYALGYYYFKEPINKYTFIAISCALLAIYFAHKSDEVV